MSRAPFCKRAQIEGQTLMYALSAIIAGFLLLFGYSALTTFQQEGKGAENLAFENSLRKRFDSVDYGTEFPVDVLVPQGVSKLCFLRSYSGFSADPTPPQIGGTDLGDCNALGVIASSNRWRTGKDVFVFQGNQVVSAFSMANLTVPGVGAVGGSGPCVTDNRQCFCAEAKGGRVSFRLLGLGRSIGVCPS
jgi:hypothetical protein